MATFKVTINDRLLDKVLGVLSPFKGKGLEIEQIDTKFEEHKRYVQEQIDLMDSGKAEFITLEELDQKLEETIKKYED